MWSTVDTLQGLVYLVLCLIALGLMLFALLDAVRQRADAFTAAGKQTKQIWLIILGVATALSFVAFGNLGLLILNIISVVAAGVYLADVRPALRNISRGGSYGPW